jgi:glutathione synthase/RimK-type ligase-like ATP-grasp enzyme
MKLRIATCKALPEVDNDEAPLSAALAAAGIEEQRLAWDDPSVDWDAPVPTLLRSTWNYALDVSAFLAWIDRVSRAAPLWNPAHVVRANVNKRYLLELAARGVPTAPTTLVERGAAEATQLPAGRLVIKPAVGAGSLGAKVFDGDGPEARAHLHELTATGAALVQPYIASVDAYGERSLVYVDGAITHAIRKTPRFAGDVERVDGPMPIADDERAVALAALAPYAADILYGRVDLARDATGQPLVMELEMIEPSLFFTRGPEALDRVIAALRARLR